MGWIRATVVDFNEQHGWIKIDRLTRYCTSSLFFRDEVVQGEKGFVLGSSGRSIKKGDVVYYNEPPIGSLESLQTRFKWMFAQEQEAVPPQKPVSVIDWNFRLVVKKCHATRGGSDELTRRLYEAREAALESLSNNK